ncbi:class A beta-lactamase-related serine hydrolase [Chryseobacterium sp. G0186]|uniref:serine hydrolase domain-containing protein n=1 Tax=Chryseobacterium sp. G0186 TaxID=2487064 RepID=UPI000F50A7B8|nr:serine hydrolase domain-containing protein [Chryseobacterium sp. G0186]AZA77171.1 class A beta-lactamase-related serine hydrolase [Chryseobacterium sp. G0186]
MKRLFLLLIFHFFGITSSQSADYKRSIDSLMNYFQENNAFSGSVLLQKDRETIYRGEFNKFPNGTDTYRIGSITKIFTAVVVFQLIEEGKLRLDTKLSTFYPTIQNADEITIGNLLSHTSGIYNYLEWEDYYNQKSHIYPKENILKLIKQGKPESKPNRESSYSNSNYTLLGYIIEDITKKGYSENIKSRIINPLGLQNTYYETDERESFKRNNSYKFDGEVWLRENDTHPSFTLAAGAMVSTTEDLSRLMLALFSGNLVSKKSLEQMEKTDLQTGIGYGLFRTPFHDKNGYGHTGRIDEFRAATIYFTTDHLTLTILTNGTNIKLNDIALGIASKYYHTPYQRPDLTAYENINVPHTQIYTGVYSAKLAGIISIGKFRITQAGKNHLYLAMHDNEKEDAKESRKVLLKRTGENEFYSLEANAKLRFLLNKKGIVTGIKLMQ